MGKRQGVTHIPLHHAYVCQRRRPTMAVACHRMMCARYISKWRARRWHKHFSKWATQFNVDDISIIFTCIIVICIGVRSMNRALIHYWAISFIHIMWQTNQTAVYTTNRSRQRWICFRKYLYSCPQFHWVNVNFFGELFPVGENRFFAHWTSPKKWLPGEKIAHKRSRKGNWSRHGYALYFIYDCHTYMSVGWQEMKNTRGAHSKNIGKSDRSGVTCRMVLERN